MNVGLGRSISVRGLVEKIIEVSGKDLRIEHDLEGPTIKTDICLDSSYARERIGWQPKISLEEGIRRTMDWYIKQYLAI